MHQRTKQPFFIHPSLSLSTSLDLSRPLSHTQQHKAMVLARRPLSVVVRRMTAFVRPGVHRLFLDQKERRERGRDNTVMLWSTQQTKSAIALAGLIACRDQCCSQVQERSQGGHCKKSRSCAVWLAEAMHGKRSNPSQVCKLQGLSLQQNHDSKYECQLVYMCMCVCACVCV